MRIRRRILANDAAPAAHLSVRAPADLIEMLDRVVAILERDRSWVILRALRQYLEREGSEIIEDAGAIGELDRGKSVPFEEVIRAARGIIKGGARKPRRTAR
jgi:predicted transcriptional regulator